MRTGFVPVREINERLSRKAFMEKFDFRRFYREAHSVSCLSKRERILLGLAVAMTRNCEA